MLVGAGTVLTTGEVASIVDAGARLAVAPNCDPEVITAARDQGLVTMPGVATPSEAFAALKAGADALKMFPGELLPPKAVKAWRAVMPPGTLLLPVGGITPDNMAEYLVASADGFGIGSHLYKPGIGVAELADRARLFATRLRQVRPQA
jgi:2-dehydro-3-deoxyphosphogalactonate aldolase